MKKNIKETQKITGMSRFSENRIHVFSSFKIEKTRK